MRLSGAHVLVTGASRGIGAEIASQAAAHGARVTLVARASSALDAVATRTGGYAFAADLAQTEDVRGLVDRAEAHAGPVDVLVNAAGIDAVGSTLDLSEQELGRLLSVNVSAPAELCRQALPGMVARGRGHIVNVSSGFSAIVVPGLTAYSASKAALSHFTAGLQLELRGTGVGTTLVELGPVQTRMFAEILKDPLAGPALQRFLATRAARAVSPVAVGIAVAAAVESGARHVVLPRRLVPAVALTWLPRRAAGVLLIGTPKR